VTERGIAELFGESALFEGISPEHLELLAGCGRLTSLSEGQELFREGDPADVFYFVRHGRIALELSAPGRGEMTISTHGQGEVVGWSWLFPPFLWHFDGRVTERGSAIVMDGACLRGKAEADHDLGYELMRRFAAQIVERLQATRIQMLDIYGGHAEG